MDGYHFAGCQTLRADMYFVYTEFLFFLQRNDEVFGNNGINIPKISFIQEKTSKTLEKATAKPPLPHENEEDKCCACLRTFIPQGDDRQETEDLAIPYSATCQHKMC
jgi:hypothetical protein